VPIKQASKTVDRTVGLGDLTAGLRTPVLDGPVILPLSSCVKVPLYGQSQSSAPSLGTANVGGDSRVLIGRSFWPMPAYGTAEIGYRRRGGFANQIIYSGEIGNTIAKLVDAQVRIAGENSRIDPSLVNLGFCLGLKIAEISLTVDVIHTISGRNTAKRTYLAAGVAHSC